MLHLLCWNVAGWKKTVERIQESYISLPAYFERHQADIVCLQEVKIPLSQLSSRSEPFGCSTIPGYESYWACCVDKESSGFNGVATYVKIGGAGTAAGTVHSADASPFDILDLDQQGRCLLTRHRGGFCIFNVYLPSSGGHSVESKMNFLNALSKRMEQERAEGWHVILAGDLNIKHTALDVHWLDRIVYINEILQEVEGAGGNNGVSIPRWKHQVAEAWPKIMTVLQTTMRVVPAQTTNTLTGETFDKFRLQVTITNGDNGSTSIRRVFLGKHETSEDFCRYDYDFAEWTYLCPETNQVRIVREANTVTVKVLTELMTKIAGVTWTDKTQRFIANTSGTVRRSEPPRLWLNRLLQHKPQSQQRNDNVHGRTTTTMVDTFRHFYPTAENRFTCWSQHTNKRYENEGVRLDYILVDASLLPHVRKGKVSSLRCGRPSTTTSPSTGIYAPMDGRGEGRDALGQEAALCAATANGAFRPVSFQGEGIAAASREALDSQFGEPHTGIVYTPPSFSDHVAVSLLLDDDVASAASCAACSGGGHHEQQRQERQGGFRPLKETDTTTRKTQPHKAQRTIASFLTSSSSTERNSNTKSLTASERLANAKSKTSEHNDNKKGGIKAFLVPRTQRGSESLSPSGSKRPKLMEQALAPSSSISRSTRSTTNNLNSTKVATHQATTRRKRSTPSILDHLRK